MTGSATQQTGGPVGQAQRPDSVSLYVHVPWCVRKCPYCDFNSHRLPAELDESGFVAALLADLRAEVASAPVARVDTLFVGGGTPSVLSGRVMAELLDGIADIVDLAASAELTLEANPGAVDASRFHDYRAAGINRLSIGVQSFSDARLQALGRIHTAADARDALSAARSAGFDNVNLDLMYGLPGQRCDDALRELDAATACSPEHLSWYQLTLEPNTAFHHDPPALPADSVIAEMAERGQEKLEVAGYNRYEISAFALAGRQCRHNLNYWRFGDYVGIGPGAHGKRTRADGRVVRRTKRRGPSDYLSAPGRSAVSREWVIDTDDLVIEFMLNALRLVDGVSRTRFSQATGLSDAMIAEACVLATERGLLHERRDRLQPTPLGLRYLNDLLALFLRD